MARISTPYHPRGLEDAREPPLAAVATQFGQVIPPGNPRYDQNADNRINIVDLAKVGAVFGQNVWACP